MHILHTSKYIVSLYPIWSQPIHFSFHFSITIQLQSRDSCWSPYTFPKHLTYYSKSVARSNLSYPWASDRTFAPLKRKDRGYWPLGPLCVLQDRFHECLTEKWHTETRVWNASVLDIKVTFCWCSELCLSYFLCVKGCNCFFFVLADKYGW